MHRWVLLDGEISLSTVSGEFVLSFVGDGDTEGRERQLPPQMDADKLLMIIVEGGSQVENGAPEWLSAPPSSSHPSASPADNRPSFPAAAEQSCTGNDTLNSESRACLPAVMNDMFLLKFSPKNFFDMIESV